MLSSLREASPKVSVRAKARRPTHALLPARLAGPPRLFGIELPRRPDVLVHAEQVAGVVAPLDFGQAAIVRAVGLLDPVDFVVGHEIDVDAARGEGCGGLEQ